MLKKIKRLFKGNLPFDDEMAQTVPKTPDAQLLLPTDIVLDGQALDKALLEKQIENLDKKYFKRAF